MRPLPLGLIALLGAHLAALPAFPQEQGGNSQAATSAAPAIKTIFWDEYRRGWHFYEEPEPEVAPPPPKSAPRPREAPVTDPRPPELIEFARLQKRLEDYRNIAIIKPTEANVRRYMELEAKVEIGRASCRERVCLAV